jgi:hypothetical protein
VKEPLGDNHPFVILELLIYIKEREEDAQFPEGMSPIQHAMRFKISLVDLGPASSIISASAAGPFRGNLHAQILQGTNEFHASAEDVICNQHA